MAIRRALGFIGMAAAAGWMTSAPTAQTPSASTFAVTSIKPHNSCGASTMGMQPGRYTASNVTLKMLIVSAYSLESSQLSGGPRWIDSDHFDIIATIPAGDALQLREPQGEISNRIQLMLRALLADRFKLAVHNESRETSIYALVPARQDKKLGPHITRSTIDCGASDAGLTLKQKESKEKSKSKEAPGSPSTPPASAKAKSGCAALVEPGRISARGMTMEALAGALSGFVARRVTDRTELSGIFDVALTWTPDRMPQGAAKGNPLKTKAASIDPNGPSLFTALQEQLGLRLASVKGPGDVLVIDRAEHPSED